MTVDKKKNCFVICPIGRDGTEIRKKSDQVFSCVVEEALSGRNYEIVRADMITESGKISTQIVNKILNADLVIADLTGQNPNVFYELAVRHAIKKPFIQIAEIDTELPFDVSDMRTIFYKLDEPDKLLSAIKQLRNFVINLDNESKLAFNSPITETILYNHIDQTGTDQEKMLANIMQGINNISTELSSRISNLEKEFVLSNYSFKSNLNRPRIIPPPLSINERLKDPFLIIDKYDAEIQSLKSDLKYCKSRENEGKSNLDQIKNVERKIKLLESKREELLSKLETYANSNSDEDSDSILPDNKKTLFDGF